LRDKHPVFLQASPKGTVPVVVDGGRVVEESLDVMLWALQQNDPEGWLDQPDDALTLITTIEGPFKSALDRYKYASRFDDVDASGERENGAVFLHRLDQMLDGQNWLYGAAPKLADYAILPFVRQFAHVDLAWFGAQPWPNLICWLETFKASERFQAVMYKYRKWEESDEVTLFPVT
jgi:glutathione S-transferase